MVVYKITTEEAGTFRIGLDDGIVVDTPLGLSWMVGLTTNRMVNACKEKGWKHEWLPPYAQDVIQVKVEPQPVPTIFIPDDHYLITDIHGSFEVLLREGRVVWTNKSLESEVYNMTIEEIMKMPGEREIARMAPMAIKPNLEEKVDHPVHYNLHPSGIECIDVVQHMNFNLGNAMKYIWRCGLKDNTTDVQDLMKAKRYIDYELARLQRKGLV